MPKRNETLSFTTSFMGTNRASASITIVDTSYPMTFTSKWSTNAAGTDTITETDEGKDVYFVIDSDNVPDGTRGRVIIVSLGNNDAVAGVADFDNYVYSTDVIISGGKASVKVSIKADQLTENRESFYAALLNTDGGVLTYTTLYINDTSKTPDPTYTAAWYSSSAGTTQINSINEGSTAWLIVKTTNIGDNTGLLVKLSGAAANFNDISGQLSDSMEATVNIVNGIGRLSISVIADNLAEGNEVLKADLYDHGVYKTTASITVMDTSRETVITVPDAYNYKGINLLPLFKQQMGRDPGPNEPIRVIVPAHIELNGFPRVIGRKCIRTEKTDTYIEGLGYAHRLIYEDTYWPAQHGISLIGMPKSELITIDVYGKIISGMSNIIQADTDPKLADTTFTPSGLPMDYYGKSSSGYYNAMIVGSTPSANYYDWLGINLPVINDIDYTPLGYAIYSNSGFNLIVRNGAIVAGHGGYRFRFGMETRVTSDFSSIIPKTGYSDWGTGMDAIGCKTYTTPIRANVHSGGILAGGGGAGGNGGGLLNFASTHWDLGLSPYYGGYGGAGAPYGGCGYTFYGFSGDPICPVRYARTAMGRTANRRLGDTGSTGFYSRLSAASASLTTGGAGANRNVFGPNGKGYQWDYTAGAGGDIGKDGGAGVCSIYVEYRWNSGKYTYTEAERISAGLSGRAGFISLNPVTYDSTIT